MDFDNLFGQIEEMSDRYVFVLGTYKNGQPYFTQLAIMEEERELFGDEQIFVTMYWELLEYTK